MTRERLTQRWGQKATEANGACLSQNVGRVSIVCATREAYATNLYRGQVAPTAGYGTKDVPNPPYMGDENTYYPVK